MRFMQIKNLSWCATFNKGLQNITIARIIGSYYGSPREIFLFFYYPSDDYMCYLMTLDELEFFDEIDLDDLFAGDPRERIMIFKIG